MTTTANQPEVYGIMAEFVRPDALIEATQHAYDRGYRMMEAYTPFPIEGLAESLGFVRNRMPLVVLIGGIVGCSFGNQSGESVCESIWARV